MPPKKKIKKEPTAASAEKRWDRGWWTLADFESHYGKRDGKQRWKNLDPERQWNPSPSRSDDEEKKEKKPHGQRGSDTKARKDPSCRTCGRKYSEAPKHETMKDPTTKLTTGRLMWCPKATDKLPAEKFLAKGDWEEQIGRPALNAIILKRQNEPAKKTGRPSKASP